MTKPLLDSDGENQAVRFFLLMYGSNLSVSFEQMRSHLKWSGYDKAWPDAFSEPNGHLTKAAAQEWLRHLFSLEESLSPHAVEVQRLEKAYTEERDTNARKIRELEARLMKEQSARNPELVDQQQAMQERITELEEALRPKPLREGLVPHAFMLEATHNNAEFWQRGGHNEKDRLKALMCIDQAVNAWKNAAYAMAEKVLELENGKKTDAISA